MPLVAGDGLPVLAKKNIAFRSGLFELVDAKFKRGLADKKYTLRKILSDADCDNLLPTKDIFYKYVKNQVQHENPIILIIQYLLFMAAGLLYLPSVVFGFYKSGFITADTSLTGESHHSLILHDYAVVWGDYVVPFIITCGIAGLFPFIVLILKIKADERKILDILNSVDAEREDTLKEHKLITCFFALCEILHKIMLVKSKIRTAKEIQEIQEIKIDVASIFDKNEIPYSEITGNPFDKIDNVAIDVIDNKIRELLLGEKFSEILKSIICKIREQITELKKNTILMTGGKKINPQFEKDLGSSIITRNRVLDIIASFCIDEIDVREDPLPVPIYLTRDLDLLGVREALFEYWGDLEPDKLVIHYTVDFNYLSSQIIIKYSEMHPQDFYQQSQPVTSVRRPCIRQAPVLEYHPEPLRPTFLQVSNGYTRPGVP